MLGSAPASICKLKVRKPDRKQSKGVRSNKSVYGMEVSDKIIKDFVEVNPDLGMELKMIPRYLYTLRGTRDIDEDAERKEGANIVADIQVPAALHHFEKWTTF